MEATLEHTAEISPRTAARVAGYSLLLMLPLGIFSFVFVLQEVVVPGDAAATASNIAASETLFRAAIGGFAVVAVLDVVVAWAFYFLLAPVHRGLSLLMAWFRLVYAAILGAALADLLNVVKLLSDPSYAAALETGHLHGQVMTLVQSFYDGWGLGLLIFGVHLLLLGYLFFKSEYIPRVISVLLIIASLGYLIDAFGQILLPGYNISVSSFTFVGEVLIIFWLLFRIGQRKSSAPQTAL